MANSISKTFILRKLHQLTGIVPLGIFFFFHMFTNAKAMYGEKVFNEAVADIHHLPFLLFIEIFGIFIPLLFHSIYGIFISAEAKVNIGNYTYLRNWLYVFQRITGIFLFFFILFHILHFRFGVFGDLGLTSIKVSGNADKAFAIVSADFQSLSILVLYILGVGATAWHLGYGIFLFAVDWGILIGEKAQKAALYTCALIALTLFAIGTNAAFSFIRPCGLIPQPICGAEKQIEATNPIAPRRF